MTSWCPPTVGHLILRQWLADYYVMAALLLMAGLPPSNVPAQTQDRMIADFERGMPAGIRFTGDVARRVSDPGESARGKSHLQMQSGGKRMVLRLPLPARLDASGHRALELFLRRTSKDESLPLRWYGLDADGQPLLQRRLSLAASGKWVRIEEPLALWRWAGDRVGRWSDVRTLALAVEQPVEELHVDDVKLLAGTTDHAAYAEAKWMVRLAFAGRPTKVLQEDGFLIATDSAEKLAEADLRKLLLRLQRTRRWVQRNFGDAARPAGKHPPISFLIFDRPGQHRAFFKRLGSEWRASIAPPAGSGYTVQDITTSLYSAEHGIDRPVYVHEGLHPLLARMVHFRTGVDRHTWLQEGLACYLQVCVYPASLDRRVYQKHFSQPIAGDGSGFFKPLATLMTGRVAMSHYAQLTSLTAFLVQERPDELRKIAAGLAAGKPIQRILTECGTDFERLQADWFAWGKRRFIDEKNGSKVFPLPQEWKQPTGPGTADTAVAPYE